jgi:outer membrane receptor for ferrienterochelin and colicins
METHPLTISPPRRYTGRWLLCAVAALALTFGVQGLALAQQGTVTGRVVSLDTGDPAAGVRVDLVTGAAARTVASTNTDTDGMFRIPNVAAGSYSLVFSLDLYREKRVDGIDVSAGGAVSVGTVEIASNVYELDPVVVTASRTQEKALEAPAAVYTVESEEIHDRTATTAVDHIEALPGADVVTTGLAQHNVVARGFNNIFSGALFVLTDNRWASVPSLRFNAYNLIPATNEDIERIEFVLGPGSALYGPNVDKGVMHMITFSPLTHQGTTVSVYGGARGGNNAGDTEGVYQLSFRHAGLVSENVGYKFSGMYFNGIDWMYTDPAEIVSRDFRQERFTGDLRFDFRLNPQTTFTVNGGVARMVRSIEMTGIGAAQAKDWTYSYAQARIHSGNLFAQAYINFSNAGDSFTLRDDELITDNSLLYVGQIQHGTQLGERQRFTYGADLIRTIPRTDGVINGRNENSDDITEVGAYLQSETALSPMFDVVLAGRIDYHNVVDDYLFSPRAAIVFKPADGHSLRVTYNRAFSQPSSNNLFLDKLSSPDLGGLPFPVRGRGAPKGGFTFERDCTTSTGVTGLCMRSPFTPEVAGGPITSMPLDATIYWDAAAQIIAAQSPQVGPILGLMNAPTACDASGCGAGQVGSVLRSLNPSTFGFDQVTDVLDVPQTKSMITNTFEAGYKGLIANRLVLGLDVYYSDVQDFIGPLLVETPNVFMDPVSLQAHITAEVTRLVGLGVIPPENAPTVIAQLTEGFAMIPVAIVTPEEVSSQIQGGYDPTTIILTYRNFPSFDLWGADIGATFIANKWFSFTGSYSYVSENFFRPEDLGTPTPLALNSPKNKASLGASYRNERLGFGIDMRGRYVQAFPVTSGVYVSADAVAPYNRSTCTATTCLDDYYLVDLNLNLSLPMSRSTVVSLTGTNIFNDKHIEMIGAPELASMWLLRVRQSF